MNNKQSITFTVGGTHGLQVGDVLQACHEDTGWTRVRRLSKRPEVMVVVHVPAGNAVEVRAVPDELWSWAWQWLRAVWQALIWAVRDAGKQGHIGKM